MEKIIISDITMKSLGIDYIKKKIYKNKDKEIVIICVGTDRSSGDCLGPLTGKILKQYIPKANIYGTLESPIHAKNINDQLRRIYDKHKDAFVIAIDACLGSESNIGKIFIDEQPLKPGAAMDKDLPEVGDISIKGIVNISGGLEFMMLQNTRLFTVMQLAETISEIITESLTA